MMKSFLAESRKKWVEVNRLWLLAGTILVILILAAIAVLLNLGRPAAPGRTDPDSTQANAPAVNLPEPDRTGQVPLETAISRRRSVRTYATDPLSLQTVSQLLWAAQGISEPVHGLRTAPSAGALYPLEILVVAGAVDDLPAGVYRYDPHGHRLLRIIDGDQREALFAVALNQEAIRNAPASLVISAVPGRTTATYGSRGINYVHMEVGHAGQNISLQAAALNLGTVVIGAFNDNGVAAALGLAQDEEPFYIMPVGHLPKN